MRLQEIREKISLFVFHATELNRSIVKEKVHKCINELKDMLLDCVDCRSPVGGSCQNCVKIQETIGWALEKLTRVEKR